LAQWFEQIFSKFLRCHVISFWGLWPYIRGINFDKAYLLNHEEWWGMPPTVGIDTTRRIKWWWYKFNYFPIQNLQQRRGIMSTPQEFLNFQGFLANGASNQYFLRWILRAFVDGCWHQWKHHSIIKSLLKRLGSKFYSHVVVKWLRFIKWRF